MMNKALRWIVKQQSVTISNGVILFGGVHDLYGRILGYYNWIASPIMMFGVFYAVVITKTTWLSWITPFRLLVVCVPFVLISALFLWKYIVPLVAVYNNYIANKNANIVVTMLEAQNERIDGILEELSEIKTQCANCQRR
jgi:hypothetical protein